MPAVILSIGDELVLGQTVDTNAAWLSEQLARRGVWTLAHHTVADDREDIAEAIRIAVAKADLVLVTGGLGPTDDDLTRQGLADAMNAPLVRDERAADTIHRFFVERGRTPTENNLLQALHPRGSRMIPNGCGTAPGIRAVVDRGSAAAGEPHQSHVFVMPGVPREMKMMFERSILPKLGAIAEKGHEDDGQGDDNGDGDTAAVSPHAKQRFILTTKVNTFGQGESNVAATLGDLMARDRNPKVGTTVSNGIVSVRVRSEHVEERAAADALNATVDDVVSKLGPIVFGRDDETIEQKLVELLIERNVTLATAESCTGGLLGGMVTAIAGSSAVYLGGWVTYSNAMKQSQLGVPEALLAEHGAVSEPVARAMAHGAAKVSGADLAVGITGVAGPGGGSEEKPVGTVWVGIAWREGEAIKADALLFRLPGNRPVVRDRAAKCALQMLRFHLMGIPLSELSWGRRLSVAEKTQ